MKEKIDPFEHAPHILKALRGGILLTSRCQTKINTMVIGWGTMGIEWGLPIFTVFVRQNRFTRSCLDQYPEFTINVPYGDYERRIIAFAGTKSGRDMDKIAELGLHLEPAEAITVPGIRAFPLTLECRAIYRQPQDEKQIPQPLLEKFYPQDVESHFHGANRDCHIAYYGQIVAAYLIR